MCDVICNGSIEDLKKAVVLPGTVLTVLVHLQLALLMVNGSYLSPKTTKSGNGYNLMALS